MEFHEFRKIARYYRDIVVSEKIDGTNGSIWIESRPELLTGHEGAILGSAAVYVRTVDRGMPALYEVRAGCRTRFVVPGADNFGFARWVWDNAEALVQLGEGVHHGEWWGSRIQRGYGLTGGQRRFSLFNAGRWAHDPEPEQEELPAVPGLDVVPVLYRGPLVPPNGIDPVKEALRRLGYAGSIAAPGFKNPEGVVVWHEAGRVAFKATLGDDGHKGEQS
jgi:hypothetical protein